MKVTDPLAGDDSHLDEFRQRYRMAPDEATRQIELAVTGGDWGVYGYTTVDQARRLAEALHLGPGSRLLDVGCGRGWPGLYLAVETGCSVVMTDVPIEGVGRAVARAATEGVTDRATAVVCRAPALPFARGSFDAVVHTDVLC